MKKGDKVKVILLNDGKYEGLEQVTFPTEPIDGIYYSEELVDVHGSVLRSIPGSNWPDDVNVGVGGNGFGFIIRNEAIIVNSKE